MRPATAVPLLVAVALGGCGGGRPSAADYREQAAEACPATHAGAAALAGRGRDAGGRVAAALETATEAVRALNRAEPPPRLKRRHDIALLALQTEAARLRAVSEQLERGDDPRAVLRAARLGLVTADRASADRLAAVGVRGCGRHRP